MGKSIERVKPAIYLHFLYPLCIFPNRFARGARNKGKGAKDEEQETRFSFNRSTKHVARNIECMFLATQSLDSTTLAACIPILNAYHHLIHGYCR